MIGCFSFEIKDRENVIDVGFRLKVAQRIPDYLEARVDNIDDKFVRVTVKGEETKVKKFYDELKRDLSGNPIIFMPLTSIEDIEINTSRFYDRLQCEQMGKFVSVGFEIRDSIKEGFSKLPKEIAKALKVR
jgi:acylphosphatase